jgi:hypothetical protein
MPFMEISLSPWEFSIRFVRTVVGGKFLAVVVKSIIAGHLIANLLEQPGLGLDQDGLV